MPPSLPGSGPRQPPDGMRGDRVGGDAASLVVVGEYAEKNDSPAMFPPAARSVFAILPGFARLWALVSPVTARFVLPDGPLSSTKAVAPNGGPLS